MVAPGTLPRVRVAPVVILLTALGASLVTPVGAQPGVALTDLIRLRVEGGRAVGVVPAGGRPAYAVEALPSFYTARNFRPAWFADGRLLPAATELVEALRAVEADGLRPQDYHLTEIEARVAALSAPNVDPARALELELLLTDAFLVTGSHLLHGRVDPVTIHAEWTANRRESDLAAILEQALVDGRADPGEIGKALEGLRPRQPEYTLLRQALARLRDIHRRGGWATVPAGPTLDPGARDSRVPALRSRLAAGGDLQAVSVADETSTGPAEVDTLVYDDALLGAVRRFQTRHGLTDDGRVGPRTLTALNVPVERRIDQVLASLERWRWLPDDLGRRHLRVNIAAFSTRVIEEGRTALDLRSIVGRQYRQTPVFSGRMTYLVLSPYWHLPPTIAAVDKLPEIKRDPGYVAAQRMTLFDAASGARLDPAAVDWSGVTGPEFNRRFRLRQEPGPTNALGDVKFMFPNRWNVYLHDTPGRDLFGQDERSFSSGCIRVERPLELAAYLLGGDPSWTPERIRSVVAAGVERSVTLTEAVPVHILYLTAFIDDEGRLNFRPDLYSRDARLMAELSGPPPEEP